MAILHGRNLRILDNTDSAVVAGARSCEISVECSLEEISSPSSGSWRTFKAGRKNWQVSVGYLVTEGSVATELLRTGNSVTLRFQDGNNVTMTGSAIIERGVDTGIIGNLAQGSFVFRGNGALSAVSNSE